MKSGLIVYVVGKEPLNWDAGCELASIKKSTKADLVEIITIQTGHFDVLDAWWSLLVRGMKHISCVIGEFSPAGHLKLKNRKLHLCG